MMPLLFVDPVRYVGGVTITRSGSVALASHAWLQRVMGYVAGELANGMDDDHDDLSWMDEPPLDPTDTGAIAAYNAEHEIDDSDGDYGHKYW